MVKPENYYIVLGVARTATEMEFAQAYRAMVQKLQSLPAADPEQNADRLQQLNAAYQTLLNPEKRKKHDEAIAWYDARLKLDRDKAIRLEQGLKIQQEAAAAAEKKAKEWAAEAARKAAEEAKRHEEEARVHAEAEARFRILRRERQDFGETLPLHHADEPEQHGQQPATETMATPAPTSRTVGRATIIGSVAAVAVLFSALLLLRPGSPPPPPLTPSMPASVPATSNANSAAPAVAAAASEPAPAPLTEASPAIAAAVPKPIKTDKEDSAKALDAQQYQKTLKRIEAEHPELNARHATYRPDLMAFVAARMQTHIKAGYPKPKALEIAVRDLETQDMIHQAIEKNKKPKDVAMPETPPPVPDKGGHAGFDPKCRWLNGQEWSCK